MHIFVSWSGKPAKELADFLQTWLRQVIQELDPFMSKNSIEKGARWSPEISKRLGETNQAIVCVTRENQSAEWLNFEAGALAKATDSRVRTLLVDITPADVTGPLSEFQHTLASNKDDVRELIGSINNHCERSLPEAIIDSVFEREWPAFEAKVAEVIELGRRNGGKGKPKRSDSEILAEILDRVRTTERTTQEQMSMASYLAAELSDLRNSPGISRMSARDLNELRAREEDARLREFEESRRKDAEESEAIEYLVGHRVRGLSKDGQPVTGVAESVLRRGSGLFVRIIGSDKKAQEVVPVHTIRVLDDADLMESPVTDHARRIGKSRNY